METSNYSVRIVLNTAQGVDNVFYQPEKNSGFGYKIDDVSAPQCLKLYYGRKTVIVPLRSLLLLELDL